MNYQLYLMMLTLSGQTKYWYCGKWKPYIIFHACHPVCSLGGAESCGKAPLDSPGSSIHHSEVCGDRHPANQGGGVAELVAPELLLVMECAHCGEWF